MVKKGRSTAMRVAVAALFLGLLAAPAWSQAYIELTTGGLGLGAILGNLNLGAGIDISTDCYRSYDTDTTGADTTYRSSNRYLSWGPAVTLGYYFGSGALRPFVNLGAGFYLSNASGSWRYQDDSLDQTSKYSYWSASGALMGGVEYFVNRISIGAGIGPSAYMTRSTSYYSDYHYTNTGRGIALSTMFRFRYYF